MASPVEMVLAKVREAAAESAARINLPVAKDRLRTVLEQAAEVAVRGAAGEDVGLAVSALEVSLTSIGREYQMVLVAEGRALAMRAAMTVISAAVSALG